MSHIADVSRKELGTRGKYAEGKVRDFLKKVSEARAEFDFKRLPDARSAGGMARFQRQEADFGIYSPGRHGLIEVKQVAHDFRLPRGNFEPTRWGGLRKRELAGGDIIILVYHSTSKLWRCPTFEYFKANADVPSWDLSQWPTYKKVDDALYLRSISVPR